MVAQRGSKHDDRPTPVPLHELEAEVMDHLWGVEEADVRTVMEALNERGPKHRAYTTYMTIMARLHRKGLLSRRRVGKTDLYSTCYEREEYMTLRAQAEVDELVSEYGEVALVHFARQIAELDPGRRRALQRLAARED
jgi:predicted transcriptional regulator